MSETANSTTIEKYLKEQGMMAYYFRGVSMLPLMRQGKDIFTVKAKGEEKCRKYDVALYKLNATTYVLHRIIKLTDYGYVFLGDNCITKEYVREEQVVGVMTSFHRGKAKFLSERTISVDSPWYKAYARVWVALFPLRKLYKLTLGRLIHRVKRVFYLLFKVK